MTETDELANALAVVLYQEVKAAGWNLEQLGRELGLSEQTMQRYLTRKERGLPARVLIGAAKAIGVPLADIIDAAERRVARGDTQPDAPPSDSKAIAAKARKIAQERAARGSGSDTPKARKRTKGA